MVTLLGLRGGMILPQYFSRRKIISLSFTVGRFEGELDALTTRSLALSEGHSYICDRPPKRVRRERHWYLVVSFCVTLPSPFFYMEREPWHPAVGALFSFKAG